MHKFDFLFTYFKCQHGLPYYFLEGKFHHTPNNNPTLSQIPILNLLNYLFEELC